MKTRFNKFLIKWWYAELNSDWKIQMKMFFNMKDITKKFKANEVLIKRYFAVRTKDYKKAETLKLRNNILFY